MSEYPWDEKNNTFTWLSSLYSPFKLSEKVYFLQFCPDLSKKSKPINPLDASVAHILTPVTWFAFQIKWLVSLWGQHWNLMG